MPRPEPGDYTSVLDANADRVWRLIVRILGEDGADAADCFQQSFVDFATRIRRSNDIRNGGSLLMRIATARAIDVVRRRIRERGRTQGLDPQFLASRREEEPDWKAEAGELLADLRAALVELPERQATAFVLTQIEDVPQEDAAKAIGVTVAHLRVLIHRSRAVLRTRLESHRPVGECHYE